jgi:hypothetical protein
MYAEVRPPLNEMHVGPTILKGSFMAIPHVNPFYEYRSTCDFTHVNPLSHHYIPEFVGVGSLGWLDYFIDPNEQNYTHEYLDAAGSSPSEKLKFFCTTPVSLRTPRLYERVREAYRAARGARFEYGYNSAAG